MTHSRVVFFSIASIRWFNYHIFISESIQPECLYLFHAREASSENLLLITFVTFVWHYIILMLLRSSIIYLKTPYVEGVHI